MVLSRLLTAVFSMLVVLGGPATGQANNPFAIAISAPAEVKTGSPVSVKITITNSSSKPVALEAMEAPYVVIVRDTNQHASPETEKGRKFREKQLESLSPQFRGSEFVTPIEPGKSITEECTVSDLYDMSRPGQYSIQVQRIWNKRAVPSNTIKVKVVP